MLRNPVLSDVALLKSFCNVGRNRNRNASNFTGFVMSRKTPNNNDKSIKCFIDCFVRLSKFLQSDI
jgi:hypothetical protein